MNNEIRLLYVTAKSEAEARELAHVLLQRRLIACANIFPKMESIYRWDDKVEVSQEAVLILKTTAALAKRATDAVVELHSYEIPYLRSCLRAAAKTIFSGSLAKCAKERKLLVRLTMRTAPRPC